MKLADLFIKLGLRKDGFDKGIGDAQKKTTAFGSAVKKIGGLMAGAFAADRLFAFGKELLQLGGIAEGVRNAFGRIADERTLIDLQKATRGTVSELELMKRAVSAQNLGLPVQNLASLFEFATKRAQDTGESVDYLVNSIVTGIGRKSPLILDNLGISAIQLREKLNGVGLEAASVADVAAAVGEIAADSMRESGAVIDTNAVKLQRLDASWKDFKETLATDPSVQTFMGRLLAEAQDFINLTTKFQTTKQVLEQEQAEEAAAMARSERAKAQIELNNLLGRSINNLTDAEIAAAIKASSVNNNKIKTIQDLQDETEELEKSLKGFNITQTDEIAATQKLIEANNKLLESLLEPQKALDEAAKKAKQLAKDVQDAANSITTSFLDIKANAPSLEDIFDLSAPDINTGEIASFADKLFGDEEIDELPINTEKIKAQIDEFNGLMGELQSMTANFIVSISTALGEALAGGGWDNFGNAVLQAVGSFLQQMGGLMIAYGIYMALFDSAIKLGPAGWPLAIAAGVGLVAAGAAISSLASGGVSGSGAYSGATASTGGSSASTALSGDVRFVLEGDKLVGAINGSRQRRSITG